MTDRADKALGALSVKERRALEEVLSLIKAQDFERLDLKKLKDHPDIYRVGKGKMRIIFRKTSGTIFILAVERRSDTTYNEWP